MATVQKRTWLSRGPMGHKVRKVAWGYTVQVNGKQERKFAAGWTKDAARDALAARILERDTPPAPATPKTLGEVAQECPPGPGRACLGHNPESTAASRRIQPLTGGQPHGRRR